MFDNPYFSYGSLHGISSKFTRFLPFFEMAISLICAVLMVLFVFTGVMVSHDRLWWVGIIVCPIMWGKALTKRRQLCIGKSDENDEDIKKIFLCILFAGITIRFILALFILPKLISDGAVLSSKIASWSKGDFIETKSLFQTAFYAFWQWLVGPSLQLIQIINAFLGGLQIALAFDLSKRIFKCGWIAIVAAAITAFHPTFICLTIGVYTELLFGIFMLLSFRAFSILIERVDEKVYDNQATKDSVILALCCLGLFYTRGNGAFMILLSFIMLVYLVKFNLRGLAKVILPYLLTIILIMLVVGFLNIKILGHFVISSSDDSYWPLLFGSCVETKGTYSETDKNLIKAKYYEIHPEMNGCFIPAHEVVSLIKKEFYRRWHENARQMINLGIVKYKRMWENHDSWISWFLSNPDDDFAFRKWDILLYPTKRIKQILAICLACWLIFLPWIKSTGRRTVLLMLLFLFLNIINHFFVEALYRYSYPLIIILSVLAPGVLLFIFSDKNKNQKCIEEQK